MTSCSTSFSLWWPLFPCASASYAAAVNIIEQYARKQSAHTSRMLFNAAVNSRAMTNIQQESLCGSPSPTYTSTLYIMAVRQHAVAYQSRMQCRTNTRTACHSRALAACRQGFFPVSPATSQFALWLGISRSSEHTCRGLYRATMSTASDSTAMTRSVVVTPETVLSTFNVESTESLPAR